MARRVGALLRSLVSEVGPAAAQRPRLAAHLQALLRGGDAAAEGELQYHPSIISSNRKLVLNHDLAWRVTQRAGRQLPDTCVAGMGGGEGVGQVTFTWTCLLAQAPNPTPPRLAGSLYATGLGGGTEGAAAQ